jgi:hypothetical protein
VGNLKTTNVAMGTYSFHITFIQMSVRSVPEGIPSG